MIDLSYKVRWIDRSLATSPMLFNEELREVARTFNAVVALAEAHEVEYDFKKLEELGVEVLHRPIRDHTAPNLIYLHKIVEEALNRIEEGKRVLVHCVGGLGRSGTIAASYLSSKYGYDGATALAKVREKVVGAVEAKAQEATVYAYALLVKLLGRHTLNEVIGVGERYNWGRGRKHASKVTQLTLRMWEPLGELLGLGEREGKALAIASLLHDIGVCIDEDSHHEYSYKMILESDELKRCLEDYVHRLSALTALHHRKRTDPLNDPRTKGLEEVVAKTASLIRIGDALDSRSRQTVDDLSIEVSDDNVVIAVYGFDCRYEIEQAEEKSKLLKEVLGKNVIVRHDILY